MTRIRYNIEALLFVDMTMCVVLRLNWPGSMVYIDHNVRYSMVPAWFIELFNDILYGWPVCLCLLLAYVRNKIKIIRSSQKRFLSILSFLTLISGLFPLYDINKFLCYRHGVYGFLLPFLIITFCFCISYSNTYKKEWLSILSKFLKNVFMVTSVTLVVRLILYLLKKDVVLAI